MFLAELTEIIFKNVFKFSNDSYLQIQGTAIGTKMAPAYANLYMGKLEKKLKELGEPHILIWKRFIDIFIIWSGSESEFTKYMTTINQIHRTIKFTHELSETELTFLDVTYKGPKPHPWQVYLMSQSWDVANMDELLIVLTDLCRNLRAHARWQDGINFMGGEKFDITSRKSGGHIA